MKTLFIVNDPPYGTEPSCNALRLARIRFWLIGNDRCRLSSNGANFQAQKGHALMLQQLVLLYGGAIATEIPRARP